MAGGVDINIPDPFDQEIVQVFDLLQQGKAFNTDCVDQTRLVSKGMADLAGFISALGVDELTPTASMLSGFASNDMVGLTNHLNDQFSNLPVNLGLMSGYIGDMEAMSRLPGYNDPATTANDTGEDTARRTPGNYSTGPGGYVYMSDALGSGVSSRALMAPLVNFMADTGSGSGGGSASPSAAGSKCGGMGDAFGSIMGKASQFMGQAMGMLGQVQGLMGGLMGGGVLGMIGKLGNISGIGGLGSLVPGIGQLSGLVSGMSNIGNLGQIGTLISSIGSFGNISALGGPLTSLLGGGGNALSNLTKLGGTILAMSSYANQTQSITGVPIISPQSPYAVQTQLQVVIDQINALDCAPLIAEIKNCCALLESVLRPPGSTTTSVAGVVPVPTLQLSSVGPIDALIMYLRGLANFLTVPGNLAQVGDINDTIVLLQQFVANVTKYVPTSDVVTKLLASMNLLITYLIPINNMQTTVTQMNSTVSALNDYGGTTGFGNVASIIGVGTSILGKLGSFSQIPGLSSIAGLTSMIPNMQGLMGSFGNLLNGNMSGIMGGLSGITGQLGGVLGGFGLGNITSMLGGLGGGLGGIVGKLGGLMGGGGLGGIMGGIGGMISGEKGMLGAATSALKSAAGAFNLRQLKDNACASGVLGNVGSDALKSAQGGGAAGGASSSDMAQNADGQSSDGPATGSTSSGSSGGKSDSLYDLNSFPDSDVNYGDTNTSAPPSQTFTNNPSKDSYGVGGDVFSAGTDLNKPYLDQFQPVNPGSQTFTNQSGTNDIYSSGTDLNAPYLNQFQPTNPGSQTFTNQSGTNNVFSAGTDLNQQYIDQVSSVPISGGDSNPPTAAQVAALNAMPTPSQQLTPNLKGGDENPPTSAQINSLNEGYK